MVVNGVSCTCGSTCSSKCVSTCYTCANTCTGECNWTCYGSCANSCYGSCSPAECWKTCSMNCGTGGGCYLVCSSGCTGQCKGCSGGCQGSCQGTCKDACGSCASGCNSQCANLSYANQYKWISDGLHEIIEKNQVRAMLNLSRYCFKHRGRPLGDGKDIAMEQYNTKTLATIFNAIKENLINSGAYQQSDFKTTEFATNSGYKKDEQVNTNQKINRVDIEDLLNKVIADYKRKL